MGKQLSYFLAPGCPAPAKRSAKPRTVLTVKRGQRFNRLVVLLETTAPRGPAAGASLTFLTVHGFLSDGEHARAIKRLLKKLALERAAKTKVAP